MLASSEITPKARAEAHMLAANCDRDWRTCLRWVLGLRVRPLSAEAIERAAEALRVKPGNAEGL